LWSGVLLGGLALAAALFPGTAAYARFAVIYGGLISAGASIASFILVLRSIESSPGAFINYFLGGMIFRLGFLLGALAAGVTLLDFPAMELVVSCLACYFAFTLLEYFFLMPVLTRKGRGEEGS
ncbi:MAG: hypothetical protein U9P14_02445, partial [Gemmatimonadota bacterium]|nr:hypothetical protein [Gemmatimonadota bacterium]